MKKSHFIFGNIIFLQMMCVGIVNAQTHNNIQIGWDSVASREIPTYISMNYSCSQMLYRADEIGIDGVIDTISFEIRHTQGATRLLYVYMAEVEQETLEEQVNADFFQQVFAGNVTLHAGWISIPLSTVFNYQNSGSLLIAVVDRTGYYDSYTEFAGTAMADIRSRKGSGSEYISIYNTLHDATTFLPNIKLGINSSSSGCVRPDNVVATALGSNMIQVDWSENGTATEWQVVVSDTVVSDFNNVPRYSANNNSYTVNGLIDNTMYYVYVRAKCDVSSFSAWTNPVAVRTGCSGASALPYSTGFEGLSTGQLPTCWEAVSTGHAIMHTSLMMPTVFVDPAMAHSGNVMFEFESNTGETEIVALPAMNNISSLHLGFYASCVHLFFTLQVGVIENDSVFVPVETVSLTAAGDNNRSYYPYTVNFGNYTGNGNRIAFKVTSPGGYVLLIDDIIVTDTSVCMAPSNFHVANTDTNWVQLAWNDHNGIAWEVVYHSGDFDPDGSMGTSVSCSSNSIVLNGLDIGEYYTAYLRSDCGGGFYSPWVGPIHFFTETHVMANLYIDTFYTCGATVYDAGGSNGNYPNNCYSHLYIFPNDPTKHLYINGTVTLANDGDCLYVTDLYTGEMVFKSRIVSNTQTIGPFVTYGGVEVYMFSDYVLNNDGFQLFVECTDSSVCWPVNGLHITHINMDSIVVAWNDTVTGSAQYIVEYTYSGGNTWNTMAVADTFAVLSQLTSDTLYDIRVRMVCNSGDTSAYSKVICVHTLAKPTSFTVPFNCTFEDDNVNDYWAIENKRNHIDQTNIWHIGNAVDNGGDSSMYITHDVGTTNTYDTAATSWVVASVTVSLSAGEYDYSFDWRCNGEDRYDNLRASLIPVDNTRKVYSEIFDVPFNTFRLYPFEGVVYEGGGVVWNNAKRIVFLDGGTYTISFEWKNDSRYGSQPPAAIDNVYLGPVSCPRPSNLVCVPDTNAITASWSPNGNESAWVVTCRGLLWDTNNINTVVVYDTFYTFHNLLPATTYNITVAAYCGVGDTSQLMKGNATTLCASYSVPFFEGFENAVADSYPLQITPCWEIRDLDNEPFTNWGLDNSHSGQYGAGTNLNNDYSPNDWLVSPSIFLPVNITGYFMEWYAKGHTWYLDSTHLTVVVITYDAIGNLPQAGCLRTIGNEMYDTVFCGNVPDGWNHYHFDISEFADQTIRVAFISDCCASGIKIDDVTIDAIPTCLPPTAMTAVCGVHDIQLCWISGGSESAWEVSDGITTVVVTDTFYTFHNLNAASEHTFTVRAICSNSDTSAALSGSFSTMPAPPVTALPYFCGFSGMEGKNWAFINRNFTNVWRVGNAAYSNQAHADLPAYQTDNYGMYISNDDGISNLYSDSLYSYAYAYRSFALSPGDYTYSFDWRAYGGVSPYTLVVADYLRVALFPASTDIVDSWWNGTRLDGGDNLCFDSNWTVQSGEFTIEDSGIYNIVFYWYNSGTSNGVQPPAAVDNLSLIAKTCPAVTAITAVETGSDHIVVDWNTAPSASAWQVDYGPAGFQPASAGGFVTSVHPVTIGGLDYKTAYDVWVRPLCGDGDTGSWRYARMSTTYCDFSDVVAIGDTTNYDKDSLYYTPICSWYRYTMSEIIIDSAEIGGPMEINAIEFHYRGNNSYYDLIGKDDIDIYIQPTDVEEFEHGAGNMEYIAVPLDTANAVHVFHGSFEDFTIGWNTIAFDVPYNYNGNGNLLVIVDDNSGQYSGIRYFTTVGCNATKSFSFYSDMTNPDITDPSSLSAAINCNFRGSNQRPLMHLVRCANFCPRPYNVSYMEDYGTYQFTWAGGAPAFQVALKAVDDETWPWETLVATNSYTVSDLHEMTEYSFRVRSVCDDGSVSNWVYIDFVNDSSQCSAPSNLHVTGVTSTSATFDWIPNGNEETWRIYLMNTGIGEVSYAVVTRPATIDGLSQYTEYNAFVVSICDDTVESNSSNTVNFVTNECQPPFNVEVSDIHDRSAEVRWTGDAPTYTIEYGYGNFAQGNGTVVRDVTGTSYTITGLTPDRTYTVDVRANCDAQTSSPWSPRVTFRTTLNAIDMPATHASMIADIYPNPTTGTVTIALSEQLNTQTIKQSNNQAISISIVDINGRNWYANSLLAATKTYQHINISTFPSGTYFVRISGDGVNMVKKLIVK